MGVKQDSWYLMNKYVVSPFVDHQVRQTLDGKPAISYGLSSMGYDLRLDYEVAFHNLYSRETIDPKNTEEDNWNFIKVGDHTEDRVLVVPSNRFILAQTYESINMPYNCIGICTAKSTYARCGIILSTSPIEPGWQGHITLEVYNANNVPIRIYPGEGFLQLVLIETSDGWKMLVLLMTLVVASIKDKLELHYQRFRFKFNDKSINARER